MTARRGEAWRWLPLLAAVAVAVGWRGGYGADSRAVVAALAGLAALVAVAIAPQAAGRAARAPVVVTLGALAAITALSAAWTTGAPADAARDATTVLALAAIVVAAAAVPGPWVHASVLLVAALASAVLGLSATIARADPMALDICGTWRPAGPFEYPPALALVCAGGLPAALCGATTRPRQLVVGGALSAWLLATTAALTANRAGVALCALAITACVALAPRARNVGPVALAVILAATASTLLMQGDLAAAGDGARVLALLPALVVVGAALRASGARPAATARARWAALVGVAAILATAAVVFADRGGPCGGDASHGRVGIWRAAVQTAAERPLQGFGAGTFLAASRGHQLEERAVPTRFAHDLGLQTWVELGIAGVLAVLLWYVAVGWLVARAIWPSGPPAPGADRPEPAAHLAVWLLAPAVVAFPLANLLDWPWALTGTGALWAVAAGGLLGAMHERGSERESPAHAGLSSSG